MLAKFYLLAGHYRSIAVFAGLIIDRPGQNSNITASAYPHIRILGNAHFEHADSVEQMLKAGASGFVSKNANVSELLEG